LARELQRYWQASATLVITVTRSTAMFAIQLSRNVFQSATCMLLAAIIVTASLAIGVLGADYAMLRHQYSVTITQLS
jgi:hypothetical protein